jgi:hypothetical protein
VYLTRLFSPVCCSVKVLALKNGNVKNLEHQLKTLKSYFIVEIYKTVYNKNSLLAENQAAFEYKPV